MVVEILHAHNRHADPAPDWMKSPRAPREVRSYDCHAVNAIKRAGARRARHAVQAPGVFVRVHPDKSDDRDLRAPDTRARSGASEFQIDRSIYVCQRCGLVEHTRIVRPSRYHVNPVDRVMTGIGEPGCATRTVSRSDRSGGPELDAQRAGQMHEDAPAGRRLVRRSRIRGRSSDPRVAPAGPRSGA